MKKSLLAVRFLAFSLSAKTTRLKTYCCIAIVLLAGCTSTQVRWDATNIRKEVMVYYNDQIMDNLVRAKYHLPFVHVDITLLTSQGMSQITGTIGAGETGTNTNASKSMTGMLGTVTNAVMRPFAWSVSLRSRAKRFRFRRLQRSVARHSGRRYRQQEERRSQLSITDLYENFANSPHFSSMRHDPRP